ncbi:MAG: AhpC/TSA family protein [Planctomycetes bacterium]|nr:AhpC/TSA family protein [Planctomycetota bacterium]
MQLRERQQELDAKGIAVAVVTFDEGPMAENYVRAMDLSWPLLVDRERTLYRAYGMLRGRAWDLYGPPAIWIYLKLMARGRRLARPGSDVTQLGGDVLVDPDGIVRLHYIGRGPADRPSVDMLLAAAR